MHRIPGKEFGDIYYTDEVPEDSLEIPYICEGVLTEVEKKIKEMVSHVRRSIKGKSLEYDDGNGKVFLRIRFKEKSLRLIMPGNEITFVDPHQKVRALEIPEYGDGNVEFEMKSVDQINLVEEYLLTSLSINDYFKPPEHDEVEDDEYTLELTDGKYDGPVVDGKPHGVGKFTWADGSYYEGSFINGAIAGEGKYTRSNGDTFDATFANGRIAKEKRKEKEKKVSAPGSHIFTFGYIF